MTRDAILALERHQVGHRAQGHQVQQRALFYVHGDPAIRRLADQGLGQLERHAHPGQRLEGIGTVLALGIDHRQGKGQFRPHGMMVGDDDLQRSARLIDLVHRADATIHGDHQAHTLAIQLAQGAQVQPIALVHAIGNVGANVGPQAGQRLHQQRGRGHAIRVKVAIDGDRRPPVDRSNQHVHRPVHILHFERIVGQPLASQERP